MSEQLQLLELVAARLDAGGIAYMVTGSIALSYYAEPRFTRDIDFVVELAPDAADSVAAMFEPDFYLDADALRGAIQRTGMVNAIHHATLIKVDLIVRKNTNYHEEEFRRRRRVMIGETPMWIVSPEDLILSKLVWIKRGGSDIHRRDVLSVVSTVADLDRAYVDHWIHELTVAALWKELAT